MKNCEPWEPGASAECALAAACDQGQIGALAARASFRNGTGCREEARGTICGPAKSYYDAAFQTVKLAALDEQYPVTGYANVSKVPEGDAPEAVRSALVGTTFHVRGDLQPGDESEDDAVMIAPIDLSLALQGAGKMGEAAWYQQRAEDITEQTTDRPFRAWGFQTDEVRVWEAAEPVNTASHYGEAAWFSRGFLGSVVTTLVLPPELFNDGGKIPELEARAAAEFDGDLSRAVRAYIGEVFTHNTLIAVLQEPEKMVTLDVPSMGGTRPISEVFGPDTRVFGQDTP